METIENCVYSTESYNGDFIDHRENELELEAGIYAEVDEVLVDMANSKAKV